MTTPPPEASTPLVTPTVEETRAINNAYSDEEIRALAQQLLKSGQLGFDPSTILKGIVKAVNSTGSPPTVTIEISGDTTTQITSVRVMNNYTPTVGHTVLIVKQGADIVVLGHIADLAANTVNSNSGGWLRATLSNGTHGGNGNGDIYYRRILDHGSWKVQWRGGWNVSGVMMIDTAQALGTEYRPTSKRSIVAPRSPTGGQPSLQWDFLTDGRVEMVAYQFSTNNSTVSGDVHTVDPGDYTDTVDPVDSTTGGGADGHTHGVVGGHWHGVFGSHDHGFTGGSHSHPAVAPNWVGLNGVEYYI